MIFTIVAIGVPATGGVVASVAAASFVQRHGAGTVAWRFAAGLPLDGKRRTDAGFFRRGTQTYTTTGRASTWAHLPHAHRAGVRWAGTLTPVTMVWGMVTHPAATAATAVVLAAAGLTFGGRVAWRAVAQWRHHRGLERPLALAASSVLGVSGHVATEALTVDRGFAEAKGGDQVARLQLPDAFHADADQQRRIEHLMESRLGIDCDFKWRMAKTPMVLEVTRAPVPPDLVTLDEVRAEIEACNEGQVVLGKDARGRIFYGDFLNEDPHWGVSAGSRRGKTTLLCFVAAQLLRQGAERVTGIDPKMISLDPLVGIPRVDIHNDPRNIQDMWDAIADFRAHMDERMDAYSKDKTLEFKRSLLIIDEINQFAEMSRSYWRSIKSREDPALPPVWGDIAAIVWQGAQLKCNVIVVGQRLDDKATGGQGLRDSFGIRMLAGYTPQQWGFLVGTHPIPRSQKPRGRFIVVNGGDHTWVQLVRADPEQVRDLAMGPILAAAGASHEDAPTGSDDHDGTRDVPAAPPVRYGLKAASADQGKGLVPMNYEALRKKPRTDPNFPAGRQTPTGTTYTAEELQTWYETYAEQKVNA